ncbi:MAG: protein-PII uridylyltransferase [Bdellovibrio sp.]|jgi:[protein-PII] uridylyltransferase
MARHDLLHILGLESLKGSFPQPHQDWGRVEKGIEGGALEWSTQLKEKIRHLFENDAPSFLASEPIMLGSLARGELCPSSDLDFVFLGPEKRVQEFVSWAQQKGLKLRSRVPEDPLDLTKGVELWDTLSLLDGEALTDLGAQVLERERLRIVLAQQGQKNKWLKQLRDERKKRHERYDSIQNMLEPSIKMGLGGLRDLDQARLILKAFPEIEIRDSHVLNLLDYYLKAFLWIRLRLHLQGQGDLINNQSQPALAEFFGFSHYRDFMFFVQRGLSRVSFYSDWILELALVAKSKPHGTLRSRSKASVFKKPGDLGAALIKDPSVMVQYEVRRQLDKFWSVPSLARRRAERGRELKKYFSSKVGEEAWIALFRSRLMDRLIPELKPLVGLVQHDQYHRYAADAHLLQVLRETLKARKSTRSLGPIKKTADTLNDGDWQLLMWTSLYHDLAKGRPQEHSDLGAKWVQRDLTAFGLKKSDVIEVKWLVQNHLAFSQAALRRDPNDPLVLRELGTLDLNEGRVRRLLVFTALDIMGTNPQAWNEWKSRLLANLGEKLLSKDRQLEIAFSKKFSFLSLEEQQVLFVISREIGLKKLQADLAQVQQAKNQTFEVFKVKKRVWLRYSKTRDQQGALADVLGYLFQSGASVLQAYVLTLPRLGIYDWFCLDFAGSENALMKRIEVFSKKGASKAPYVQWEKIQQIEGPSGQMTLLFKGMDQRGLLWSAAESLTKAGLEIQSAVVQTWGQKAEDLFVVKVPSGHTDWFEKLELSLNLYK